MGEAEHRKSEIDLKLYEAHFNNGGFVLKVLFTLLGGGLLASASFFVNIISNVPAETNMLQIDWEALISYIKYSYWAFLAGLIFALVSSLCFYFANRKVLENKENDCFVCFSIFFGIIGLLCFIAGLIALIPAYSAFSIS